MDLQQAQRQLTTQLSPLYGGREAAIIADWVMERLTGRKRIDRLVYSSEPLSNPLLQQYEKYRDELLAHRPVQYVLHESWFCGMKFDVDERVLIPRPETEELVEWVAQSITIPAAPSHNAPASDIGRALARPLAGSPPAPLLTPPPATPSGSLLPTGILDVGTGSGCIAIALAKKFPVLAVHACDISEAALDVARHNALTLDAGKNIHFHQLDFLDSDQWVNLPAIRWLVSNPPYIPLKEKSVMAAHVTGAEPSLALFVPDDDPLIFYRTLGNFARQRLAVCGSLFVEIHEDMSAPVMRLFRTIGAKEVLAKKDLQGKDRMVKATW
jgi:release factor glutamine methyltransferase